MGSENSSDPYERIKQLEKLVEDQEEQIDELRGTIENHQSTLAHRMQVIEKLQRERDELRKQNAELVNKVAQLSRRQSVTAGSSSPSINRSRNSPPQLPRWGLPAHVCLQSRKPCPGGDTESDPRGCVWFAKLICLIEPLACGKLSSCLVWLVCLVVFNGTLEGSCGLFVYLFSLVQ